MQFLRQMLNKSTVIPLKSVGIARYMENYSGTWIVAPRHTQCEKGNRFFTRKGDSLLPSRLPFYK